MKNILLQKRTLAVLTAGLLASPFAFGATIVWNGLGDLNWSSAGNWAGGIVPTNTDDVKFYDDGANATVGVVNNTVDGAFSGRIASLQYGNTNSFHTTQINPGATLTNSGNLVAGTETDNGGVVLVGTATITGSGGTLLMNNTASSIIVRQGANGSTGSGFTLDLSGLDTFIANVSRVQIGDAGVNRSTGILLLAKTNTITASGGSPQISLGLSGSNNGAGLATRLSLGQTNAIFANSIAVARQKQTAVSMIFNPAFADSFAYFRGVNGVDRVSTWTIGDGEANSGTTSCNGTVDFSAGTVDAKVDTMTVARASSNTGGTGNSRGTLTFSSGIIDVNTLQVGIQTSSTGKNGDGVVNVNGTATLSVNTVLRLGQATGGAGVTTTRARVVVNGGTLKANSIATAPVSGGSSLTVSNSGTLVVTNTAGTPDAPLSDLALGDATVRLGLITPNATNIVVTNLTTSGAGNVIIIGLLSSVTSYPAQFRLIKYANLLGAGYNFTMSGLPVAYTGFLSNNTALSSIDLVLTSGPIPQPLKWTGAQNGNWNDSTFNWRAGLIATNYNDGDFATLDDTASGTTTINLTTALLPGSVTVSNNSLPYTFTGSGSIAGLGTLTKEGSATLLIDNSSGNSFAGAMANNGGTLQIGNNDANGSLGSGSLNNNAALVFNRTDDFTVANSISGGGSGTITKNGAGVLALSGASTFTGPVTVAQGTLKTLNSAALGATNGTTTINNGATLDIGANAVNLGLERIFIIGSGVGGNGAIVNNSGVNTFVGPNVAFVTMTGDTTFGGSGRWDLRAAAGTSGDPATAALSTGGNGYKLTKVGSNTVNIVSVTIDPALGDIDVLGGTLGFEGNITSAGNPASTISVASGADLRFFQVTNRFNKNIVLADGAILENNSGVNTVIGPMTLNGTATVIAGGTSLTLSNTISGTGGLTKVGGAVLALAGGPDAYSGNTTVSNGTLVINTTLSGGGTLTTMTNTTLAGNGTHTGPVNVGGALLPGDVAVAGTFGSGNLTLNAGSTMTFDLSSTTTIGSGVNDLIQVNGNLVLNNNTVMINLLQLELQAGTYRLINYSGSLSGNLDPNVSLGGLGASRYVLSLDTSTPGQVNLVVSGTAATLRWNSASDTIWDIATTPNWFNFGTSLSDTFYQADKVLFDDSPVVTFVNIPANVAPAVITNNSTANSFFLGLPGDAGRITGGARIVKQGDSTLNLGTTNDFTGTVTVEGGTLQIGNNGALGSTAGATIIKSGASLDVGNPSAAANAVNLGLEPIMVSGAGFNSQGAIVNNSVTAQQNSVRVVTMVGNTTLGGAGRWDIRGTGAALSTGGNAYNITKVGLNQISLVGVNVDPALGDVDIQQGIFSFETSTTSAGNPAKTITVEFGATLQVFALTVPLNKVIVMNGDGSANTFRNSSGANVITGPISLNGSCIFSAGGTSLAVSNVISGSGSLTKSDGSLMSLSSVNTYTGDTTVSGGTLSLVGAGSIANTTNITIGGGAVLDVGGSTSGTLTLGNNRVLSGNGTLRGILAANAGSTVLPGGSLTIGQLTVTNAAILGAGSAVEMEIDKLSFTNDVLSAAGVVYNGTLRLVNLGISFGAGDSFKLFKASSYSGAFTAIDPPTPGPGLLWKTTDLATSGTLRVVSATPLARPVITSFSSSGVDVTLTGNNGPANGTYYVLGSTNVALPASDWTVLATGYFDGSGTFTYNAPIDPERPQQFYMITVQQ